MPTMIKQLITTTVLAFLITACNSEPIRKMGNYENDLNFDQLATSWDEAIPLGNATIGSLVWLKEENLRISIDRIDLWNIADERSFFLKRF